MGIETLGIPEFEVERMRGLAAIHGVGRSVVQIRETGETYEVFDPQAIADAENRFNERTRPDAWLLGSTLMIGVGYAALRKLIKKTTKKYLRRDDRQ